MQKLAPNIDDPDPYLAPEEIEPQSATQELPGATEPDFEPLATCPQEYRGRYERRAKKAAREPREAIRLKCLECCGWYYPEVKRCQITGCPLYALSRRIFKSGTPRVKTAQTGTKIIATHRKAA